MKKKKKSKSNIYRFPELKTGACVTVAYTSAGMRHCEVYELTSDGTFKPVTPVSIHGVEKELAELWKKYAANKS